ncbi:MAG: hypothetical protein HKP03_00745 [Xanthomonadales bacterium]|nr:hypothetical protein [Xanthomonadales bacterium]
MHAPDVATSPDDCWSAEAPKDPPEADNRSFRSGPPDTTPYSRPLVPEDRAPRGEPAIPPGVTAPAPGESLQTQTEENSKDGGN